MLISSPSNSMELRDKPLICYRTQKYSFSCFQITDYTLYDIEYSLMLTIKIYNHTLVCSLIYRLKIINLVKSEQLFFTY